MKKKPITKIKRMEEGFVHREVTHTKKQDYLPVIPNPNKKDKTPLYLKAPQKKPKRLFKPLKENWTIPKNIEKMYDKNNNKKNKKEV